MGKGTFFKLILKLFYDNSRSPGNDAEKHVHKNIWAESGRKAQMDMRSMMQMRPFTSSSKFSK